MNNYLNKSKNKQKNFISEINVTPFVDVLLVLLIIFMITAPMLTGAVDVDLPKGDSSKQTKEKNKQIVLSISKNQEIYIDDKIIKMSNIKDRLVKITNNNLSQKIYIKGDKSIDYGLIMRVIKKINESGFSKVILVTNISQ